MAADLDACCRDCVFRRTGTMNCVRRAPIVVMVPASYDKGGKPTWWKAKTAWPVIEDTDWCGEFERDPSAQEVSA